MDQGQSELSVFNTRRKSISNLMRLDALMELETLKKRKQQEEMSMQQDDVMMDIQPATISAPSGQIQDEYSPVAQKFRVSQKFGNYNPQLYAGVTKGAKHYGVDIATPKGTKVYAPVSGQVVAGEDKTFGKFIRVLGDDGVVYQFSHLSGAIPGGRVKAGQPIAQTGSTGRSTGAHLDIMAKRGQNYIDPLSLPTIKKLWL